MLNSRNAERLIEDYLHECWTEPTTDLYSFVSDRYEELVRCYGFSKIETAIEACLIHMTSDENEEWTKAAKKFTKREILEINTMIGFLCGIAEVGLRKIRTEN